MSKPADVTQGAWDAAIKCAETVLRNLDQDDVKMEVVLIAKTIQSAQQAAYEEAAKVALCHSDDRPRRYSMDWNDGYIDACQGASKSILKLGAKP